MRDIAPGAAAAAGNRAAPGKLAEGMAARCLLSLAYILSWQRASRVRRVGINPADAFVYLTGSAARVDHSHPRRSRRGEAAIDRGAYRSGREGAVAVSAVRLFRLLTFWLPVPLGWVALNYMERHHDL